VKVWEDIQDKHYDIYSTKQAAISALPVEYQEQAIHVPEIVRDMIDTTNMPQVFQNMEINLNSGSDLMLVQSPEVSYPVPSISTGISNLATFGTYLYKSAGVLKGYVIENGMFFYVAVYPETITAVALLGRTVSELSVSTTLITGATNIKTMLVTADKTYDLKNRAYQSVYQSGLFLIKMVGNHPYISASVVSVLASSGIWVFALSDETKERLKKNVFGFGIGISSMLVLGVLISYSGTISTLVSNTTSATTTNEKKRKRLK
jgi:hypothetical protein